MKFSLLLTCVFFSLAVFSQEKKVRPLLEFNSLMVQGRMNTLVVPDSVYFIELIPKSDKADLNKLSLAYKGDVLEIKYPGGIVMDMDLDLVIHVPRLSGVSAKQGAFIRVENGLELTGAQVVAEAFAGGIVTARIQTAWAKVEIGQGGEIAVSGISDHLECTVVTGGYIDALDITARKASVSIKFGGSIDISVQETLEANVTSGGTIRYKGNPVLLESITLGGRIEKILK